MKSYHTVSILLMFFALFSSQLYAAAQNIRTPVECGTILEAELAASNDRHFYAIDLHPGDSVIVGLRAIGVALNLEYKLTDPANNNVNDNRNTVKFGITNAEYTHTDSSTGSYTIQVQSWGRTAGAYVLSVGCQLRDGTVISPGDVAEETENAVPDDNVPPVAASTFSGVGFPGLPPVDFSDTVKFPLILNTPMTGAITPTGGEILVFQLNGTVGQTVDLSFTRLSGNLNLSLVVLSEDNLVIFQATLVNTQSLTARFPLPADGQYTIGIFRVDLTAPESPETTAFTVQADFGS